MSKHIGKILVDVIPEDHHWKIKLFNNWKTIIGTLTEKVRIEKITENSLTLGVCHATWAQELYFLTPMLKKKINALFQEEKIKHIKFKTVGKPIKRKEQSNKKKILEAVPHQEHSLTIIEHSKLQGLANPELAHVLKKFYLRCKTMTSGSNSSVGADVQKILKGE